MDILDKKKKLPKEVISIWRIHNIIEIIIYVIILSGVLVVSILWNWSVWIEYIIYTLYVLVLISIPLKLIIIPKIRWNYFNYIVRVDEINIQSGAFIIKNTLIPTTKIQKINILQGPLLRSSHLASVTITTAASEETIPGLPISEAQELRRMIIEIVKDCAE